MYLKSIPTFCWRHWNYNKTLENWQLPTILLFTHTTFIMLVYFLPLFSMWVQVGSNTKWDSQLGTSDSGFKIKAVPAPPQSFREEVLCSSRDSSSPQWAPCHCDYHSWCSLTVQFHLLCLKCGYLCSLNTNQRFSLYCFSVFLGSWSNQLYLQKYA